jgi:nucleotide-binding universal stress UspA family protein
MSESPRPADWDHPVTIPDITSRFERLLVPFDGSHCAESALAYAALLATRTGGEIIVVVAYDAPVTVRRRGSLVVPDTRAHLEEEADELASEAVAALTDRGCRARGIVVKGDPVDGILDVADDEAADIIILGRRGLTSEVRAAHGKIRAALQHLTGGAVADKVAKHADVPVLLVG